MILQYYYPGTKVWGIGNRTWDDCCFWLCLLLNLPYLPYLLYLPYL